jgi:hypothetical protein
LSIRKFDGVRFTVVSAEKGYVITHRDCLTYNIVVSKETAQHAMDNLSWPTRMHGEYVDDIARALVRAEVRRLCMRRLGRRL